VVDESAPKIRVVKEMAGGGHWFCAGLELTIRGHTSSLIHDRVDLDARLAVHR
jgi:hypothetical protein